MQGFDRARKRNLELQSVHFQVLQQVKTVARHHQYIRDSRHRIFISKPLISVHSCTECGYVVNRAVAAAQLVVQRAMQR